MPKGFLLFFCLFVIIIVSSMACGDSSGSFGESESDREGSSSIGASSSGEDEELAERFIALSERVAEVEDDLCNHDDIDEVWEEFGEWQEETYGDILFEDDYLELSDKEKKRFLDGYEDLLDDLEGVGRKVCR